MDNTPHYKFLLSDRSYVSLVKKDIKKIAEKVGLDANRLAEVEIIISEITSNILKHSSDGYLLVKHLADEAIPGIEILSIDQGPGMANPHLMLKDGVSTTSTLGQGLGAIKRLSDDFDLFSAPGIGTILLSRVFKGKAKKPQIKKAFNVHTIMVSKKGETFCGDGYHVFIRGSQCQILAFDGLGHGPEASKAAEAAISSFKSLYDTDPSEALRKIHKEIKNTRGGVGMIFSIDAKINSIKFCGVGNISARIFTKGKLKSCISYNGIVGNAFPNSIHTNNGVWNKDDILIITSDGISSRWDPGVVSNLLRHDPTVIAAYLFKEYSRGTDDSLVLVVK